MTAKKKQSFQSHQPKGWNYLLILPVLLLLAAGVFSLYQLYAASPSVNRVTEDDGTGPRGTTGVHKTGNRTVAKQRSSHKPYKNKVYPWQGEQCQCITNAAGNYAIITMKCTVTGFLGGQSVINQCANYCDDYNKICQ